MFNREILAFGGGKGGVGKSIVSANVAILLSQKNLTVVIIDADLGAANLHTCLGMSAPKKSLVDFLVDSVSSINECITPTPYSNLYLISGAQDSLDAANPTYMQMLKLIEGIKKIDADYIIIDLGAGTSHQIIDMFIQANKGILVAIPEPTSIENTYRFIKHAIYRKFRKVVEHSGVRAYLQKITLSKESAYQMSPVDLIQEISLINPTAGAILNKEISSFQFGLVLNQVISNRDIRLGFIMQDSCKKYFGVNVHYTGVIESDQSVLLSSRERKPVLLYNPFSPSSRALRQISENIINKEQMLSSNLAAGPVTNLSPI